MPARKPTPECTTRADSRPGEVTVPTVAACGHIGANTGTRADLLIFHHVVNKSALKNRPDRARVAGHFEHTAANLGKPEALLRSRFTPRHADDADARAKKDFAVPVFRRPISLGSERFRCAKWPREWLKASRNKTGSASLARRPAGIARQDQCRNLDSASRFPAAVFGQPPPRRFELRVDVRGHPQPERPDPLVPTLRWSIPTSYRTRGSFGGP